MKEILKSIKSPSFDINLGFGIIVLGLVMIIVGTYPRLENWMELGKYVVTLGLGLFSVGLALAASEKMKSIANVQFLQVVNMLEDARVYFIAGIYKTETYTWKTKSSIEMAVELLKRDEKRKYIELSYQDKLFHYFNISFKHFFKLPDWKKEKKSMKHLIESYASLDDYYNYKRKQELEKYINSKKEKYFKNFYTEIAKEKIKDK